MRFERRLALAVATWLLVAPPPLASGFAQAQEIARAAQAERPPAAALREAAPADAARRRIRLDLENTPLASALGEIARLGQLRLTYSPDVLPAGHRVSLRADSLAAGEALQRALHGTGLEVRVSAGGDATGFRASRSACRAPSPAASPTRRAGARCPARR